MSRYELKTQFLETWPLSRLQNLQLDEYTNLDRSTSFCYWLEKRTEELGSIWGGSSYKFGIYRKSSQETDTRTNYKTDGTYAWHSKYGNDAYSAFLEIKKLIVAIAADALQNHLESIDEMDLGYAYKWKIAFLYSNYQVINIFKPEALLIAARAKGMPAGNAPISVAHKYLVDNKPVNQDYFEYTDDLWALTGDKPDPPTETNKSQNAMSLNTILYGPPGTGKTYHTINRAIAITNPDFVFIDKTRKEIKDEYQRLYADGQIAFTTFHQSLGYEDFIEGIKPILVEPADELEVLNKTINYKIEPGIFFEICKKARYKPDVQIKRFQISKEEFNKTAFFKISLGNTLLSEDDEIYDYCIKNSCIALGWGGSTDYSNLNEAETKKKAIAIEKSGYAITAINHFINYLKKGNYVLVSNGNNSCRAIGKVTGDYYFKETDEIDYYQFRKVEWLVKDVDIPVSEIYHKSFSQQSIYKLDNQNIKLDFFVKSAEEIKKEASVKPKNYVLIIDEINRGNVSQIFGELITLIEDDKREGCAEALEVMLPYSKKSFSVPPNLYIIGTMNTADRSVEALDTALRRRFSFIEMLPQEDNPDIKDIKDINLKDVLKSINRRLETLLSRDHMIGHSFFLNINDSDKLHNAFYNKIIPQLQEYFFGDYGKIGLILGKGFITSVTDVPKFADFEYDDKDILLEKKVYRINNFIGEDQQMDEDRFLSAVKAIVN
ncbi:AAA family ATPase [Mucilaginibacter ginsenosidivorax]|uniref:AAA+ ATPase domain-containing protein n=1 Tax=Mucilaginibacter ginsenosidivorax TaxID=862126 RepID=A0A5B8VZ78_9SPHI|nr:AAA family ATPase [Mucilaginibacter ginsenosidivorax]QEC76907.1 hypothetical protein FSB76_13490 [Mucilaginibacter ginsenosidivorax]